ncbi:hypothetical protein [Lysobacter sp. Hz 25]|uniref:hypothetical protein n=1 Tax=Lysobacter sp. Hz 25 TaxID=3383698 RepID=UPI0038D4032B
MADSIPSRPGQINKAGDDWALFIKNYTAEVDAAFVEAYKLDGRIMVRSISSGKSASFPAIGTIGSRYHVPGTDILGQTVDHNERILTLDPMLISDAFIANIDEAMNHFDVRGEYTRQQGYELARKRMMNELRCAIRAARITTSVVEGQPGGAVIKNTTMGSSATVLAGAFRAARQVFDEKNLSDNPSDYTAALRPAQYYLLTENKDLIDKDINTDSKGSYNDAVIASIARLPIVKINCVPNTNETADTSVLSKYRADYSNTVGTIFHRASVGTLQLLGLSVEDVYQGNKQGTLMLSKYALGHGELRADGAIELSKAA